MRKLAILMLLALLWNVPARSVTAESDLVIVVAGDIAACGSRGDEATALLLDQIAGMVIAVGDVVYPSGTLEEYRDCYGPSWGRHKARTRPVPGNHDYTASPRGEFYYEYFGKLAGPRGLGFYSFNLGRWHIIALNSVIGSPPDSPQDRWLRADLEANRTLCTLAYWHHPVFSSLKGGGSPLMQHTWDVLYAYGVDVVINGDNHVYDRFAPMNPAGQLDQEHGIRQFTVGTGGSELSKTKWQYVHPNSEVRDSSIWGVLKLTLHPTSYDWEFVPAAGGAFRDAGSAPCVASIGSIVI